MPNLHRRLLDHLVKRQRGRCKYCDCILNFNDPRSPYYPTVDHVIPRARNGMHTDDNIVAACKRCNNSKSNQLLEEWKEKPNGY